MTASRCRSSGRRSCSHPTRDRARRRCPRRRCRRARRRSRRARCGVPPARAGRRVTVLEREPHVGGLAASFEVAGQRVDHGSHRLHPSTPAPIMATLRETARHGSPAPPAQRTHPARGSVRRVPAPAGRSRAEAAARAVGASRARHGDESVPQGTEVTRSPSVVRGSLGPTMADRFYAPYVEKLFGVPATQLAAELARRRIGASSASALVRRVVRPDPDRGVFFYPRRGYGQIPEAIASAAARAGAVIRTETEVAALDRGSRSRRGAHCRRRGHHRVDGVVDGTAGVARPARVGAAARARGASQLETRAMVLVYLASPDARSGRRSTRTTSPSATCCSAGSRNRRTTATATTIPQDVTVLCAEIPCERGDARFSAPGDDLAAQVRDALAGERPPDPAADRRRGAPHPARIRCIASASRRRSRCSTRGHRRGNVSSRSGARGCSRTTTRTTHW